MPRNLAENFSFHHEYDYDVAKAMAQFFIAIFWRIVHVVVDITNIEMKPLLVALLEIAFS